MRYMIPRILSIFLLAFSFNQLLQLDTVNSSINGIQQPNQNTAAHSQLIAQAPPYSLFLPIIQQGKSALYVSPQGNDANPGSLYLPWKTIRKAASSVKPGDLVYIRGGTYHEYVTVSASGTQSLPIQFAAYPGENPVIDGENTLPNSNDGLLSLDGDWIEVTGLEVKNSTYIGIGLYGKHNTLNNVYAHHSSRSGVHLSGDYSTIQDSRIWRNSMHSEYGVESGSSGITVSRGQSDNVLSVTVRNNTVWENWGQGINVHFGNGVIVEGNTTFDNYTANIYIHDIINVVCQRNFIYMNPDNTYMGNSGPEVGIMMGEEYSPPIAKNIQVINNIAFGNRRNLFWYTGDMGGGMDNVLFAYNTFVNGSGDSSNGNSNVILDPGINNNVRFMNNIVYQQGNNIPPIDTKSGLQTTYSHNFWSTVPIAAAIGTDDKYGDPLFMRTGSQYSADWFQLQVSSLAINNATSLTEVLTDYFGSVRGTSPDMGAIESKP